MNLRLQEIHLISLSIGISNVSITVAHLGVLEGKLQQHFACLLSLTTVSILMSAVKVSAIHLFSGWPANIDKNKARWEKGQ